MNQIPPPPTDKRQSETALRVQRGTMRFLRRQFDMCCYPEITLANGRRSDILGVGRRGEIWIIEIKSSSEDFRIDNKWHEYKDFCDRFYFAKPPELDAEIFPDSEGLIVADGHGGKILRQSEEAGLPAARRKAIMLRLARIGADRMHTLMDPGPE
jgi:hypothetical protein